MDKPTRIIKEPTLKHRKKNNSMSLWIECDNGKGYRTEEIEKIFGIRKNILLGRLSRWGWENPYIFDKNKGKKGQSISSLLPREGSDEWGKLGTKARTHNLMRIPCSEFERQLSR